MNEQEMLKQLVRDGSVIVEDEKLLKSCPFCGSPFKLCRPNYLRDELDRATAICSNDDCWAHMPDCHYEVTKLLKLLNTRPAHGVKSLLAHLEDGIVALEDGIVASVTLREEGEAG